MKKYAREILLAFVTFGSFVVVAFLDPIPQDPAYHNFADDRTFLGVTNFFDVVSNLVFLLAGLPGLLYCLRKKQTESSWAWIVFFSGVTAISLGSGYYHWTPDNDSLVWDRLPMTVGFMGFFVGLLGEYVKSGIERVTLVPAVVLGLASIFYWHFVDDLRFYAWVQFFPLLALPIILIFFKSLYSHQRYFIYALVFYALAKVAELYDHEIFSMTCRLFSGHSLKHVLAAAAPLSIYLMLKKRIRSET